MARQRHLTGSTDVRLINPLPEPPGKVRSHQSAKEAIAAATKDHSRIAMVHAPSEASVQKMSVRPPTIEQPRRGQKFLLTGTTLQLQARISHAGRGGVQVEIQQETGHGFRTIHPRIGFSRNRAITIASITLQQTGHYRLRARVGSGAVIGAAGRPLL